MGHKIHIQSKEQHMAAVRVLREVKGTWLGLGTSSDPIIVVTDEQYRALVAAGVIEANGKKDNARGKKAPTKKTKS